MTIDISAANTFLNNSTMIYIDLPNGSQSYPPNYAKFTDIDIISNVCAQYGTFIITFAILYLTTYILQNWVLSRIIANTQDTTRKKKYENLYDITERINGTIGLVLAVTILGLTWIR